jgi:hypothetical protein
VTTKAVNVSVDDTLLKLGAKDLQGALAILVARLAALEAEAAKLRTFIGLDFEGPDTSANIPGL